MTMLGDWISSDISGLYNLLSKTITFRRVVSTGGASPAVNPVNGAIAVQTTAALGASSITLTAPTGNYFLEAGDKFKVAGDTTSYTVSARVLSASGKFTGVTFTPVLAAQATAGAVLTMTWTNDYPVKSIVTQYDARLIDGSTITSRDLRCLMQPIGIDSRALPAPTPVDKLIIDGTYRSVGMSNPQYCGDVVSVWDVQAKG